LRKTLAVWMELMPTMLIPMPIQMRNLARYNLASISNLKRFAHEI
jgi:hypothetical protein